ncbi:hypothetical protein SDRG_13737 [Saprolegnia diclina VS20]|uniref:Uncharacterized protein n=1 Tax=Saprolegnia diclina (strain VS20) TaxID=1156394 RepID=T0R8L1_SAPDV|nr:hypothetical protein SDRG_13737 [Saprolegnia diclina VS20]EQC28408.1 hypothetical protein SDRG_13737 [Saprolegnia diclina VS20]|eukprot:XP_008618056.1 hypothetical protein SDRG_13737 [Saprolegnia diclina VS20]
MADNEALVYSGSVYAFAFDAATQAHKPLSESPLGVALLASPAMAYRLLCYNAARDEVLSTPLTDVHAKFTVQQDHYVSFYDDSTNYSMRFKDDAAVHAFVTAIAAIKAHLSFLDPSLPFEDVVVGDGYGVQMGDIVGIAIDAWQTTSADASPADLLSSTPIVHAPVTELQKLRLGDTSTESIPGLSKALVGMQKGGRRFIYLPMSTSPKTLILAHIELLKIKKEKRGHVTPPSEPTAAPVAEPTDERHGDLVNRMALLSRMGSSQGAVLLPQLSSSVAPISRRSSLDAPTPSAEPSSRVQTPLVLAMAPPEAAPTPVPLRTPTMTPTPTPTSTPSPQLDALMREKETLLKEQAALAKMRQEWEDAARQPAPTPAPAPAPVRSSPVTPPRQPTSDPVVRASTMYAPLSMHAPPSSAFFEPTPFLSSFTPAPAPVYTPTTATYASTPPFTPPYAAAPVAANSAELDASIQRVARTTLSMEGMLLDLQSKMDRLLAHRASPSTTSSYYRRDTSSSSSSYGNTSLLKSMEKVLSQNEEYQHEISALSQQLQDVTYRSNQLQDDLDRAHNDNQRMQQQSSSQARISSELQNLQAALDHAKQRSAQVEADLSRALARADDERNRRLAADDQVQHLTRAMQTQSQTSADAALHERQLEEARSVAMASQKKWADEKQALLARLASIEEAKASREAQLQEAAAAATEAAERTRTQMQAERESHNRDAAEAMQHLNELVAAGDDSRKKHAALEAQLRAAEERADDARAKAAAATTDVFKELMNDIYFACQDAFEEDGEFTGKEVAITIRKILKQQTATVLSKLETSQ